MIFGRESAPRYTLGIAIRLRSGIAKEDSLKNRDFWIIFRKASISFLCFVCIASTAAITVDLIVLAIDCLTTGFMEL